MTVKTSGTPSAPITFAAADTYFSDGAQVHAFTLDGVSNVVIRGLQAISGDDTVLVSGTSNITIENSSLRQGGSSSTATTAAVHVTGASSAVTVQRNHFGGGSFGEAVRVDGGSTGTVVATNVLDAYGVAGIAVAGASGTEIAGNTLTGDFDAGCDVGISVAAASSSTSVENNVVTDTASPSSGASTCPAGTAVALAVSADSAATTTAQYNVLSTDNGDATPYDWAGTTYDTAAAFQAATGKGAQDDVVTSVDLSSNALPTSSPLLDSADVNAAGKTSTDIYGNSGYDDRGALEYEEYTSSSMSLLLNSPQHVTAQLNLHGVPWGSVTSTINWGDGTAKQTSINPVDGVTWDYTVWSLGDHYYALRGTYTVTATLTDAAGTKTVTGTISTQGSTYQPVAPTRVLDTRHGIGTGGSTTPVPANGDIAVDVTSGVAGAPAPSTITAVVLNVTVTAPTGGGYITAYPDGTVRPTSSNLNFSPGETVPNLVTVRVGADGKVALHNGSAGTVHLVADVAGYYVASTAGSGYVPVTPTRLLDTRNGTGTGGSTSAVPAGGTISLKIDGNGPVPASGVTAVVLNVTVTRPAASGYITVHPGATAAPKASNLNFSAGETVPNLVIVPVGANGAVSFTNGSAGPVALVGDVAGYYRTGGGHTFAPLNPSRVLDTRTGRGQDSAPHPVAADSNQFIDLGGGDIIFSAALVLNVTVTGPTAGGFITAHPDQTLPAVSNLNFSAGETVPNLVMMQNPHGGLGPLLYNGSAGTTNLVADAFGFFS